MNYPSVWSWIAKNFGLQAESNYLIFVSTTILLFLLCCYLLLRKYPSITLLLMCFSGATILAVERGNNDIMVFVLLFLAASSNILISAIVMFAATSLKIYPLLALPAFLKNLRNAVGMAFVLLLAIAVLWTELPTIYSATPINAVSSYGSVSILLALQKFHINFSSIALTAILISVSLSILAIKKFREKLTISDATDREERLFLVGSCVFVGTFILASNWDYRLIFLLFCVPFLMRLKEPVLRFGLAVLLLIAMNFFPLFMVLGKIGVGLNILSKVILFITLIVIILMRISPILLKTNFSILNKKFKA
jgi:hypothetical protein